LPRSRKRARQRDAASAIDVKTTGSFSSCLVALGREEPRLLARLSAPQCPPANVDPDVALVRRLGRRIPLKFRLTPPQGCEAPRIRADMNRSVGVRRICPRALNNSTGLFANEGFHFAKQLDLFADRHCQVLGDCSFESQARGVDANQRGLTTRGYFQGIRLSVLNVSAAAQRTLCLRQRA
jgi:hypothetical protein